MNTFASVNDCDDRCKLAFILKLARLNLHKVEDVI